MGNTVKPLPSLRVAQQLRDLADQVEADEVALLKFDFERPVVRLPDDGSGWLKHVPSSQSFVSMTIDHSPAPKKTQFFVVPGDRRAVVGEGDVRKFIEEREPRWAGRDYRVVDATTLADRLTFRSRFVVVPAPAIDPEKEKAAEIKWGEGVFRPRSVEFMTIDDGFALDDDAPSREEELTGLLRDYLDERDALSQRERDAVLTHIERCHMVAVHAASSHTSQRS